MNTNTPIWKFWRFRMNKDTKIIWKPIDGLIPYEHNAKEHTEKQLANLEESFRRYGWQQPCLITNDNVIITGHGRALGAKRAGLTDAPCIYCDDLSEKEIKEYRHLDNLLSDGEYIQSELEFELPELDFSDFDLEFGTGDVILDESIDGGEIEDKTEAKVAVKIIFKNAKEFKREEEKLREFVDEMENVSISVGEYNED